MLYLLCLGIGAFMVHESTDYLQLGLGLFCVFLAIIGILV